MGHFQSCCGTLTLRHAELSLEDKCMTAGGINSVHCGLCKVALTSLRMLKEREREKERKRERERERERGEERRRKRGGGDRPREREKTRQDMKNMRAAPAWPGSGSPWSCKADATKEEKGNPGRPPERRRRRRTGRERRAKKTPKPNKNETPEKNPAAFSIPKLARTLDPNYKAWPQKNSQYITGVLPTKLLDTNVPKKRRTLKKPG